MSGPSPFVRDVVTSALAAAVIMGAMVLVTGWLAAGLGPVLFGVYGLARRFHSTVASVVPGPLGVGLVRALAIAPDERDRLAQLWAGTLLALAPALVVLIAAWVVPAQLSDLVFSSREYADVARATTLLIAAMSGFSVAFAWYRGTGRMRVANLWQVWVLGVGPLVIAGWLARSGDLALVVTLMAAVAATSAVPLLLRLRRAPRHRIGWREVRERAGRLWAYSVPRLPAGLAYTAIFSLGPFLAPYAADLRHAGFLVAGQSALRIVDAAAAGFGLVVLPKAAAMQARNQAANLRARVEDLLGLILHLGLFATCQLVIWTREIVAVWLGGSFGEAVPVVRIILLAVMPYLVHTMLRSIIDGVDERPINARNIYLAFGVTAVLSALAVGAGLGAQGLAAAGAAGTACLGLLSLVYLRRLLGLTGARMAVLLALGLNLSAAAAALAVSRAMSEEAAAAVRLCVAGGAVLAMLICYAVVLRRSRVPWVLEVERRLRGRVP